MFNFIANKCKKYLDKRGDNMENMFCYQCQEAAGGKGCSKIGVCGKKPETATLQDTLVCNEWIIYDNYKCKL